MTIMTAKNALAVIGKKLEKEYKRIGFKYSKKNMFLKKRTRKYDYYVFFSRFFEHMPGRIIELHIIFIIHDRALMKGNINSNSEVFHLDLWETGNQYSMANETLADNAFMDLKNKIDDYLLPQTKKLEEGN
jgi:hypothetical protein